MTLSKYKFEEIAINCTQKRFPTEEDQPLYIGLEHLDTGNLHVDRWGSPVPLKGEKLIMRKGDVLLGRRNAYLRRAAVAPHDGLFSAHGMVLQPREDVIDKEFFPLFIASDYFFDEANRISVGSLSPTINWKDLRSVEFEIPSMEKQRELAKVLWAMDTTKRSYQKLLKKTDELVKAQFVDLFKDTERVRLDTIAEIIMGQSPSSDSYNTDGQGMPFYQGSADFSEKYVKTRMYCTAPTRVAKAGDVLMSVRAPVGTVNLTDKECCIGRGLAAIRSKKFPEYNEFLLYAFRVMEDEIASMGQGSTVLSINKDKLHGLLVPNAEKQQQELFISLSKQSDKSRLQLKHALAELTAMYKRIISDNLG